MNFKESAKPASETVGVRLTKVAAEKVKELVQQQDFQNDTYLYVGVKGGGCSGLQWVLDIRDAQQIPVAETDEVFESNGIIIVCDLKSYIVGNLAGTELDYESNLMQSGFVFKNPNSHHTCGCQKSFSV